MNRLEHVKQTLPQNIKDNEAYGEVEFVVLDYNSSDGLEQWVAGEMGHYIDLGLLIYLRYEDREYFHRSHSRNLAMKSSSGEIICNLDADNYTGPGFAAYINRIFREQNIFLTANYIKGTDIDRDCFGRVCFERSSFYAIGGYDEKMDGYGGEDMDICNRLLLHGCRIRYINDRQYLTSISHSNKSRIENEKDFLALDALLVCHITPFESHVLKLYKNNTFEYKALVDNVVSAHNPLTGQLIPPNASPVRYTGICAKEGRVIELTRENHQREILVEGDGHLWYAADKTFCQANDPDQLSQIYFAMASHASTVQLNENIQRSTPLANEGVFGSGKVIRNFKYPQEV
jgi:hypothetical protein